MRSSLVVAVVVLASALVHAHADGPTSCGYTFQGQTIDLSNLTVSGTNPDYTAIDSNGYTYNINVCAASTVQITSCQASQAAICQSKSGIFVSTVAKWPDSGTPSGFSMIDPNDFSQGIQLSFGNGDSCFPTVQPRVASIQFVCGSSPAGSITPQNNGCSYAFVFPTSFACVKGPEPPKPSFSPPPQYVSDTNLGTTGFTQTAQAQYQDVNKDGYVDLVYSVYRVDAPSTSVNQVYLNNGTAWVQASSGQWKSPVPIDRAIALIRSSFKAGLISKQEYRSLMVVCAHPKFRSGIEVLHSNLAADGSEEGAAEFIELALEYLAAVSRESSNHSN